MAANRLSKLQVEVLSDPRTAARLSKLQVEIVSDNSLGDGPSKSIGPLGFIADGSTLYAPTVLAPPQTGLPGFIASSEAVYAPTMGVGPITIVPGFIPDGSTLYAPLASNSFSVPVGFISDGSVIYAPTPKQTYPLGFITSTDQTFPPRLVSPQVNAVGFIADGSIVYPPTFAVGPLKPPPIRRVDVSITPAPLGHAFVAPRDFSEFADVMSIRIRFGFDQRVAEASVITTAQPQGLNFDDRLSLALGSPEGGGTVNRFIGYVRDFRFSENPPRCETILKGSLIRAQEYENFESTQVTDQPDGTLFGSGTPLVNFGLFIPDLTGTYTSDSATIVSAVLAKAGVNVNGGIIAGSDVQYGGLNPFGFEWKRAPLAPSQYMSFAVEPGESAMSYIDRYDLIDAELTGGGSSGGRYRTFDTAGGQVFRTLIGGVPAGAAEFVFEEGIDILDGSFTKSIDDLHNYFVVHGFDPGNNDGGIIYELVANNGIQTTNHTQTFSSDMIERFDELDTNFVTGMSAERVAKALAFEQSVISGWITTWREDLFGIGQTHLVKGPGGLLGRMGISSELLWVQSLEITFDEQGFTQRIGYIGGLST